MLAVDSAAGRASPVGARHAAASTAPNESVDPAEIADMALVQALFLQRYAEATAS